MVTENFIPSISLSVITLEVLCSEDSFKRGELSFVTTKVINPISSTVKEISRKVVKCFSLSFSISRRSGGEEKNILSIPASYFFL